MIQTTRPDRFQFYCKRFKVSFNAVYQGKKTKRKNQSNVRTSNKRKPHYLLQELCVSLLRPKRTFLFQEEEMTVTWQFGGGGVLSRKHNGQGKPTRTSTATGIGSSPERTTFVVVVEKEDADKKHIFFKKRTSQD